MARSRIALVLPAFVLPTLLACNGILGLGDFEKTECPGARCGSVDAGGTDASVLDAALDAPPGTAPVSWARWRMPNYDAGADALPNAPAYTAAGDVVTDRVTSLVWHVGTAADSVTYDSAVAACNRVGTGWRLAKRIELVTLLDYSRGAAPYIADVFGVFNVPVWTSSEARPFTSAATARWIVDFNTGAVATQSVSLRASAMCVRDRP